MYHFLVGDSNEILSIEEKNGGPEREEWSFQDFRNMITTCNISDLRHIGNIFSWVGVRGIHTVKCCLDIVMWNDEFLAGFPTSEAELLQFYGSDHRKSMKQLQKSWLSTI